MLFVNAEDSFPYATGGIWEDLSESGMTEIDCSDLMEKSSTKASIPSRFDITANSATAAFFPPIGDQGQMESCTAWATTYYQFTYEVNRFKNEPTTADNTFSPAWTYNYIIDMNKHIAAKEGKTYAITDYIDSWGCSLADVIEEEYNTTIEQYIADNYDKLHSMNVIPAA